MHRRLASSLLLILLSCAACSSQQTDIDYKNWPGQFGELVRLLEARWHKGGEKPQEPLRIIELLEAQGQLGEAMNRCQDLAKWSDDFKKDPWAGLLRKKTLELEKKLSSSSPAQGLSSGALARLKAKLPPCHIQELDLPEVYRQAASEERLKDCFLPTETHERLAAEYPILTNHLSLEGFWKSEDGKTVGVLIYDSLGPLLLYSRDGGRQWLGPFYLGLHRLPHFQYLILADSKLPLIAGQRIQIEVTIWAVDHSQPGGGLMGYKYLWKKWHKMLSIPLDRITLDSDGDGLTDLFEERILTDPNSPDSDQDGWNDAVDNQPLVPKPGEISEADRIFLSIIAEQRSIVTWLFGYHPGQPDFAEPERDASNLWSGRIQYWLTLGLINRPVSYDFDHRLTKAGMAHYTGASTTPIPPQATTFIQAEQPVISRITGAHRWIVFNRHEADLYRERFGKEFEPDHARISPFLIDPGRKRAYLVIRYSQCGEGYALEKQRGQWRAKQLWTANYD